MTTEVTGGDSRSDWHKFAEDFSMHGVKYVHVRNTATQRRVVWQLLIFGVIIYFGFSSSDFFDTFSRKLLTTKYTVEKSSSLRMPTITICNRNLWQLDMLMRMPAMRNITRTLYLKDPVDTVPPEEGRYDWTDPDFEEVMNLTSEETQNFWDQAAHFDILVECWLFSELRPCEEILKLIVTDGGYCWQFNSEGNVSSTQPGLSGGLSVAIWAHTDNYAYGPNAHSEGFSLTFHNWDEEPLVNDLSIGIAPGTQSAIAVSRTKIKRFPPPADDGNSDCFDTASLPNPLEYYEHYSYSGCYIECRTRYVLEKCGCRDHLQPALHDSRICLIPEMLYCSAPALSSFPHDADGLMTCDCPETCETAEYEMAVSDFKFPSYNFIKQAGLTDAHAHWLATDFAIIEIFYSKLEYAKLEEIKSYGAFELVANVGGTLGLCIGMSILTGCELVEFLLLQIFRISYRKFSGRSSRVQRVTRRPADANSTVRVIDLE